MLDSTADNDDLTPLQEYVIAGGVILAFGLLYWFLNHGEGDGAASMAANTSAPQVVMMTAPPAPVETASVDVNNVSVAPDTKKKDTGSALLTAEAMQAPLQTTPVPIPVPTPDTPAVPAVVTPNVATLETGAIGPASSDAAATASAPAAPLPTLYTMPDGSQIDLAASRFGLAFRDAIAKRDTNKPIIFDEIRFDSGASKPNPQSDTQIQQVVALLHANPDIKLLIRGHTDEVGTAKDNTELSLIRANEVGVALVQAGIDRRRLRVMGMGSSEPISVENTDAARERNRRIDALILK